jgi:DNA-binding phage protein
MASKTEEKSAAALSSGLGRKALVFDDDAVVHLLRAAIEREGSQTAFAKGYGVNRSHINEVLNGKRHASGRLLKALGLRKVYVVE